MSSRAILMVGCLALFCIALFTALIFESTSTRNDGEVQLDMAENGFSGSENGVIAETAGNRERGSESGATRASGGRVFTADPYPISAAMLTSLEQASEEPLNVELGRLMEAVQQGFGESSAQIEPTLRPYAFRLAGRLNIRLESYRIHVSAPIEELAYARAESLSHLFEAAGVLSNRLTFTPRTGIHNLSIAQS
ncbi:MAG: hypothetical protein R3284_02520 [Rubricoccaceae bacterium]|nr:hypothetical protein [Rubricoccaceae bacterium]